MCVRTNKRKNGKEHNNLSNPAHLTYPAKRGCSAGRPELNATFRCFSSSKSRFIYHPRNPIIPTGKQHPNAPSTRLQNPRNLPLHSQPSSRQGFLEGYVPKPQMDPPTLQTSLANWPKCILSDPLKKGRIGDLVGSSRETPFPRPKYVQPETKGKKNPSSLVPLKNGFKVGPT